MTAVPAPPPTFYVCPGERHAISRSVHWGRLAAFYDKCRDCPHRDDAGLLPTAITTAWRQTPRAVRQPLEFTAHGLRGRYLNDLDRQRAFAWATAFAAWLWDQRPLIGRLSDESEDSRRVGRVPESHHEGCRDLVVSADSAHPTRQPHFGPMVVVGFDERPPSPDLAVGVVTALRQMGCRVIDIGLTTAPIWRFAAREFAADGGAFITGAGCEPSWTGLDWFLPHGLPDEFVHQLAQRVESVPARPTRTAGSVKTRAVLDAYAARLPEWFHALRPLHVVCATPVDLLRTLLPRVFAELPCRLTCLLWPRQRDTAAVLPAGSERLSAAVRDEVADVGLLIAEDGATCTVFDEQGNAIPRAIWQPWLLNCVPHAVFDDGALTLGALLQALSLSDAPLSERVAAPV
jgi:phosphomannomutase